MEEAQLREYLWKWAFFNEDRDRVLSYSRYRPPTPVLVEVKKREKVRKVKVKVY